MHRLNNAVEVGLGFSSQKFGKARDGPSMLKLDVKDSCSIFFV